MIFVWNNNIFNNYYNKISLRIIKTLRIYHCGFYYVTTDCRLDRNNNLLLEIEQKFYFSLNFNNFIGIEQNMG